RRRARCRADGHRLPGRAQPIGKLAGGWRFRRQLPRLRPCPEGQLDRRFQHPHPDRDRHDDRGAGEPQHCLPRSRGMSGGVDMRAASLSGRHAAGATLRPRGWWYPWLFVAALGLVVAVNGVLISYAVGSFSGLDTAQPYERGLDYNATLAAARAQEEMGW